MKFTKMHGIGNDYVYVDCFRETVLHPGETAKLISDRHFGIGSDGLVLIKPSETADFKMEMYNIDGTMGEMCGNAIRCVAKYVYEHGMAGGTQISIETLAGIKYLELTVSDGKVVQVRVNMGRPELAAEKIPVIYDAGQVVSRPVRVDGREYKMTCVSMGNPHCVVYIDDVDGLEIEEIGPKFEHLACFPRRVNAEFAKVLDRHTVQMRVWERGCGETLACGTGACAVAAASILNGFTEDTVIIQLRGGDLQIEWDRQADLIYMTGPAETVFEGEILLPDEI